MKEQFVPYEIAEQLLNEYFNEDCLGYYQNKELVIRDTTFYEVKKYNLGILAPLWQQVIDWLREKHNIDVWVQPFTSTKANDQLYLPDESYSYFIFKDGCFVSDKVDFFEPSEAREAVIKEALTLI
jgi:hypothetical protein